MSTNLPHDFDGLLKVGLGVNFRHCAKAVAEHSRRTIKTIESADFGRATMPQLIGIPTRQLGV